MFTKLFQQKNKSKVSINKEQSLAINFKGSERLLPSFNLYSTINSIEVYNNERYNCNTIRLNCVIKPYCSNVLFNPFTEIVQNEGSNSAICLNFETGLTGVTQDKLIYKEIEHFNGTDNYVATEITDKSKEATLIYNSIDDTQLSSTKVGNFIYHCGLDFLNNHVLRNNTFKTVTPLEEMVTTRHNFNTLSDYHRHYDGSVISGDTTVVGDRNFLFNTDDKGKSHPYMMHLYEADDVLTFKNAFKQRVVEENGWFGFINKGKIKIYDSKRNDNRLLDISKPINNAEGCEFIDFYPTRDLFYFTPKYNTYRHRIEKNWNYLLTYPSSIHRDYDGVKIPFINDEIKGGALRIFLANESFENNIMFYSMSKHGLVEGDYVNIYKDNELIIHNLKVMKVYNEYDFMTNKNGYSLGSQYDVESNNEPKTDVNGTTTYKFKNDFVYYYDLNSNFMSFSFKKLKDGNEVDYYVKILSRMPNWKFSDKKVTKKLIYDDDVTNATKKGLLERHQIVDETNDSVKRNNGDTNVFESHVSKLAFAKTIYNDDVSEIIFTDDINIDFLQDNLKRPLTELFLTVIKNNKGYNEWYTEENVTNQAIEYSHCFDVVTCGFYLNKKMYDINKINGDNAYLSDAKLLCHAEDTTKHPFSGLNTSLINVRICRDGMVQDDDDKYYKWKGDETDDVVNYYKNINFYGDLYSYCHETCEEELIQTIDYRFNTWQREHNDTKRRHLNWCDINKDDYDTNSYSEVNDFLLCKSLDIKSLYEGYYYQGNYRIPIKTFASDLEIQAPKMFNLRKLEKSGETSNVFLINTFETNFLEDNDYFILYKKPCVDEDVDLDETITAIKFKVLKTRSLKEFVCELSESDLNNEQKDFLVKLNNFKLEYKHYIKVLKPDITIPDYAELLLNGTCQYVWRYILPNGFDERNYSNIETYPFTNDALYVMKPINLYLKRQNPDLSNNLTNNEYGDFNIKGNFKDVLDENKYVKEDDMLC